jgi:hypothetical protein
VAEWDRKGVFGGEEEGGGVRSGPGEARTILLLHIISVRPSKQPLMVRTFLKVYMELGSYFLFLQEQIKDIIIGIKNNVRNSARRTNCGKQRKRRKLHPR